MSNKVETSLLIALACMPCCLPLLGITIGGVLAISGSALIVAGTSLAGVFLLLASIVTLYAAKKRNRLRSRPDVAPIAFYDD
jgi:membrane protein implicated in regulation of membrane protease activity